MERATVKLCPRCGYYSLEVFPSHEYCAECNFSGTPFRKKCARSSDFILYRLEKNITVREDKIILDAS